MHKLFSIYMFQYPHLLYHIRPQKLEVNGKIFYRPGFCMHVSGMFLEGARPLVEKGALNAPLHVGMVDIGV